MIGDHRHRANLEAIPGAAACAAAARAAVRRAAGASAGRLSGHLDLVPNMALQLVGASRQLIGSASRGRQSKVAAGTAQTTLNRGFTRSVRRTGRRGRTSARGARLVLIGSRS